MPRNMSFAMKEENILSEIETLILMLLEAKDSKESKERVVIPKNKDGYVLFGSDQGKLLHLPDMHPSSSFSAQIGEGENERLFSCDYTDLLTHPREIFGEESETVLVDKNTDTVKWTGFRRLRKPPKSVVCLGKADSWYEMHYREYGQFGRSAYQKRLAVYSKEGRPLPSKKYSHWVSYDDPASSGILHASLIEDAHRSGTMLASVSEAAEIKFPVPIDSYKEIFIIRDAPLTAAGKRKAILHWVSKHLRKTGCGRNSEVKEHTRGVDTFNIAGFNIKLSPNVR